MAGIGRKAVGWKGNRITGNDSPHGYQCHMVSRCWAGRMAKTITTTGGDIIALGYLCAGYRQIGAAIYYLGLSTDQIGAQSHEGGRGIMDSPAGRFSAGAGREGLGWEEGSNQREEQGKKDDFFHVLWILMAPNIPILYLGFNTINGIFSSPDFSQRGFNNFDNCAACILFLLFLTLRS